MILIGDIGASKTLLALGEVFDRRWHPLHEQRYLDRDYRDFTSMLRDFLEGRPPAAGETAIQAVCFGVAGPVTDGAAYLGNRGWTVDAADLAATFCLPQPILMNDLVAAAQGLPVLRPPDLVTLQAGILDAGAVRTVISVGTGYNAAHLVKDGQDFQALGGEAGHVIFAPTTPDGEALCGELEAEGDGVEVEDVISGRGLVNIYRYMRKRAGDAGTHTHLTDELDAAAIAAAAERGDTAARNAITMFVDLLGRVAGDQALSLSPQGGLYIAGGIPLRLLVGDHRGRFMKAFKSNRRLMTLTEKIPVHLVMREDLVLLGCMRRVGAVTGSGATIP